jgi:HK97 family phage prohead protease
MKTESLTLEQREVPLLATKFLAAQPGTFSGYGAVFGNVDGHGDVIEPGAFTKSLDEWRQRGQLPKMLLNHGGIAWGTPTPNDLLPIGQWTRMAEDHQGLRVEGSLFALNTERGQYIYEGLKAGVLDGLSIGYLTRDALPGRSGTRRLTDLDVREVSIATFPSNEHARIASVKSLTIDELRDLEGALRDGGLSRTDRLKAVTVFKRWLQRDAGAPNRGPRDEATPDESETRQLLDALDDTLTSAFMRSALRR